jgi:N-acetylneuraminic acid mutarotase
MAEQRYNNHSICLDNGKVLSIGNVSQGVKCEIFDPLTNSWSFTGSLNQSKYGYAVLKLDDGRIMLIGGHNGYKFIKHVEIFDPKTEKWSYCDSMNIGRAFHSVTKLLNGDILVIGGGNHNGILKSCEIYNHLTNKWILTDSISISRHNHGTGLLPSGDVIVFGGTNNKLTEIYNTALGTWNNGPNLWRIRNQPLYVSLNDGRVLVGGYTENIQSNDSIEIYDPTLNKWDYGFRLNSFREAATYTKLDNGNILFVGGRNDNGPNFSQFIFKSVEVFNPNTFQVNFTDSLNIPRWGHRTVLLKDGSILVVGGVNNVNLQYNNCEIWTKNIAYKGNKVVLTNQGEVDRFKFSDSLNFSKIIGNLTIDGSSNSNPISNLNTLNSLKEITGTLTIRNLQNAQSPKNLNNFDSLMVLDCGLNISNNTNLDSINLKQLNYVGCGIYLNNNNCKSITLPKLCNVKGDIIQIKNNSKTEQIEFSNAIDSFQFIGKGSSLDVSNNGKDAIKPLKIDFNKIKSINGPLTFNNNDNIGVSNFDSIFSKLTTLKSAYGNLSIKDNDYLNNCCVAANITVGGNRSISNNTGNCATLSIVSNYCGGFHKRTLDNSIYSNSRIDIYPNPAKDVIQLYFSDSKSIPFKLYLYNATGQEVFKFDGITSNGMVIPLNDVRAGLFYSVIWIGDSISKTRIIIQN